MCECVVPHSKRSLSQLDDRIALMYRTRDEHALNKRASKKNGGKVLSRGNGLLVKKVKRERRWWSCMMAGGRMGAEDGGEKV
jgi:hypothetical protein